MLNRKRVKVIDPLIGEVEAQYDAQSKVYYIERDHVIPDDTSILLSVESVSTNISERQYDLIETIRANFSQLKKKAYEYLIAESTKIDVFDEAYWYWKYRVDSIFIPIDDRPLFWELDFLNHEDGFTHCIVGFQGLNPVELSTEG